MRRTGILLILGAVALPSVLFPLMRGFDYRAMLLNNLQRMEIVLREGTYIAPVRGPEEKVVKGPMMPDARKVLAKFRIEYPDVHPGTSDEELLGLLKSDEKLLGLIKMGLPDTVSLSDDLVLNPNIFDIIASEQTLRFPPEMSDEEILEVLQRLFLTGPNIEWKIEPVGVRTIQPSRYEGRLVIRFAHVLSASLLIFFVGIGMVVLPGIKRA